MIAPSRLSPHFLTPRLEGEGGDLGGCVGDLEVLLDCHSQSDRQGALPLTAFSNVLTQ
jgi:hypothetical protein